MIRKSTLLLIVIVSVIGIGFAGNLKSQSSENVGNPVTIPPPIEDAYLKEKKPQSLPVEHLIIKKSDGEEFVFDVEIADSFVKRKIGLMFRESLPENHGMLFLFEDEKERGFWMKNTYIPLDLIYINKSGEIKHIHKNAKPHSLESLPSKEPVMAVLEIAGGSADVLDLQTGDTIIHPAFGEINEP